LVELLRYELGRTQREMHAKYKRGKTLVQAPDGRTRQISTERLFACLDHLKSALHACERALDKRATELGPERAEMKETLSAIKGSFTTFNLLFADREDYFSSKD
jgi:hypothetical protein